jgi:hypothetical protein
MSLVEEKLLTHTEHYRDEYQKKTIIYVIIKLQMYVQK